MRGIQPLTETEKAIITGIMDKGMKAKAAAVIRAISRPPVDTMRVVTGTRTLTMVMTGLKASTGTRYTPGKTGIGINTIADKQMLPEAIPPEATVLTSRSKKATGVGTEVTGRIITSLTTATGNIRAVVRNEDTRVSTGLPTSTREARVAIATDRLRTGTRVMALTGQTRNETGKISKGMPSPGMVDTDKAQALAEQVLHLQTLTGLKIKTVIPEIGTKTEIMKIQTVAETIETNPAVITIPGLTMVEKAITAKEIGTMAVA